MRKINFLTLAALCLCAWLPLQADQTTQGKDFWVTFMQADQATSDDGDYDGSYNTLKLSLSITSQYDCDVTISNPYTDYQKQVHVTANQQQMVEIYSGSPLCSDARQAMATNGNVCYAVNSEQVDTCALHVTATADISLFATNYKKATFDATNVIPTSSLLDEYYVQCYSPSNHSGNSQGSHFAIIATEDNTVVDYVPTVFTLRFGGEKVGDTLTTPTLMKGQVFYVWTGNEDWDEGDLSGSYIKARDGKPIAVFQGNPHTNIPYQVKQRDHIYSQAMPTQYWGTTFVPVASKNRKRDVFRLMALYDGTQVYINDSLMHTFDFVNGSDNDKKHFYEFELGDLSVTTSRGGKGNVDVIGGNCCYVHTSCICALHQFTTSQMYGVSSKVDGDPGMMWVNPVEQQIDTITFGTYSSSNGTTNHYTNIVTTNPSTMMLDGTNIANDFKQVGSSSYYYAQKSLGTTAASHTLINTNGQFIATVYGFTSNESYAYSAGGATKPYKQSVFINGVEFKADDEAQTLCGLDTVKFSVQLDNVSTDSIKWGFGDGTKDTVVTATDVVPHLYAKGSEYDAYCIIYFTSKDQCGSTGGLESGKKIPIKVNTQQLKMQAETPERTCADQGEQLSITFNADAGNLLADQIDVILDAKNNFKGDSIHFDGKDKVTMELPDTIQAGNYTGTAYFYTTNCGSDTVRFEYHISYPKSVIQQRWGDVLGITAQSAQGEHNNYNLSGASFQWYMNDQLIPGATQSVLYQQLDPTAKYTVEITQNGETSFSCPFQPTAYTGKDDEITLKSFYAQPDGTVTLMTSAPARATFHSTSGKTMSVQTVSAGQTDVRVPNASGLYILHVQTAEGSQKSFKVVVR